MNNTNYWRLRESKARDRLLTKSINTSEKELRKIYRDLADNILTKVELSIEKMAEGKSVSHTFNYRKYYELLEDIQKKLHNLGDKEISLITNDLKRLYKDSRRITEDSYKIAPSTVNNDRVKSIINSTWVGDGKNWSERIWSHQAELSQRLATGLLNAFEAGIPIREIKRDLIQDFNVSYNQASRIVRTEYVHIANVAATDRYKEAGISKYRILVNEDERTCPECSAMDGKEFYVTDDSFTPPFHPNCRCTTVPVLEELNSDINKL